MDPKMRKLVDYLLANYQTATLPPDPTQMPPMTDDQRRVDAFVRGAPAHLPVVAPMGKRGMPIRGKNAALVTLLRSSPSKSAYNANPVDD